MELEARLSMLSNSARGTDAFAEDEIRGIYDLLPQFREALRKEIAKRKKHEPRIAS